MRAIQVCNPPDNPQLALKRDETVIVARTWHATCYLPLASRYAQTPQFIEAVVVRWKPSDGKTTRQPQISVELRREQIVVTGGEAANLGPARRAGPWG